MNMGKIILVGATKGGVGKSVSSYNLAYSLASEGKTVLAVDFDSQANLSTCFGIEDPAAVPVTIGHLMMTQIDVTEHGVTGDTFSTLFINNREAMVRTRPLDMTKRFLNTTGYDLSDEESYVGNVVDVLNPHRLHQGKKITFGVNLMELQVESPDFEPIVAVRPLKAGVSLWTTNSAGNTVPLAVKNPFYNRGFGPHPTWSEIKDTGYPRNVKLLEVGENATNESAIARANYYFSAINCEIPKSFKVKALDVAIYNEFNRVNDLSYAANMIDVGDPITIVAEPYGLNDSSEKDAQGNYKNVKICLAMKLDILNPQNNEYTIGDYIPEGDDFEAETLTKKFANEKKKKKK